MATENLGSGQIDVEINTKDLNKDIMSALKRVDKAIKGADLEIEIDNRTALKDIDQIIDRVDEATKDNKVVDIKVDSTTSIEVVRELQRRLDSVDDVNVKVTADVKNGKDITTISRQLKDVDGTTATAKVRVDTSAAEKDIKSLKDSLGDIKSEASGAGGAITGALAAGAAIVGGSNAVDSAYELQQAIIAVRGTVAEGVDADKLEASIREAFVSMGGQVDSMQLAQTFRDQFNSIGDSDVAAQVVKVMGTLRKTTGKELNELSNAFHGFQVAFKDEDPAELLNSFAYAVSNAPDMKGDLLDGLSEYSVQLKAAGFNSAQSAKLIEQSAKSNYSLDKALDGVKERYITSKEAAKDFMALNEGLGNTALAGLVTSLQQGGIGLAEFKKQLEGMKGSGKVTEDQFKQVTAAINDVGKGDVIVDITKSIDGFANADISRVAQQFVDGKSTIQEYGASLVELYRTGKVTRDELERVFNDIGKGPAEDLGFDAVLQQLELEATIKAGPIDLGNATQTVADAADAMTTPLDRIGQRIAEFTSTDLMAFLEAAEPSILALVDGFAALLGAVGEFMVSNPELSFWIAILGSALTIVASLISGFIAFFNFVKPGFSFLARILGFVWKGLSIAWKWLGSLLGKLGGFTKLLSNVGTWIGRLLSIGGRFIPIIGWVWLIWDAIAAVGNMLGFEIPSFLDIVIGSVKKAFGWIIKLLEKIGVLKKEKDIELETTETFKAAPPDPNMPFGYPQGEINKKNARDEAAWNAEQVNVNIYNPSNADDVDQQMGLNFDFTTFK